MEVTVYLAVTTENANRDFGLRNSSIQKVVHF